MLKIPGSGVLIFKGEKKLEQKIVPQNSLEFGVFLQTCFSIFDGILIFKIPHLVY